MITHLIVALDHPMSVSRIIALRWRCQRKPSALALLQSGTHCPLTVARLSSPAHSDEAC